MSNRIPSPAVSITDDERETLRVALERGYFEWPKAVSLVRIADELGRSDVDVLEQLSTGMGTILRDTDVLESQDTVADSTPAQERLDGIFDALQHPYRRRILVSVRDDNPLDEAIVLDNLATWDDDRTRLATELYHAHLPRLARSGYIEWETERRTVRRGPNFDEIAPILRQISDRRNELTD